LKPGGIYLVSTKKDLLGNELMKEIITIRFDALWKMLRLKQEGRMPKIDEEGATGKFDNKGAIFVPGGMVYADVDEMPIAYDSSGDMDSQTFRAKVRAAMQYDNATLLYADGMSVGVNLDTGFFSKAARQIFAYKKAAMKRNKKIGEKVPFELSSNDITRSHCPAYVNEPYGSRTRISACLSVGLIEPHMFYAYCQTELRLRKEEKETFSRRLDTAQEPVLGKDQMLLFPPFIIVCHNTRYREDILTGITRILGFGKFGEFATFTFEDASKALLHETKSKKEEFAPADLFAQHGETKVVGVLRIYAPTTPGKRSPRATAKIISPSKDLGLDLGEMEMEAKECYQLSD
jgi:hypothetical protein